jgi:glycine oxidase
LPAVRRSAHALYVNGLYRHGFLLAPAMARQAAELALRPTQELPHANLRQRRSA